MSVIGLDSGYTVKYNHLPSGVPSGFALGNSFRQRDRPRPNTDTVCERVSLYIDIMLHLIMMQATHWNTFLMWTLDNCRSCDEEICWEYNLKYRKKNSFIYCVSDYRLHRGVLTTIAWNDCHNWLSKNYLFCGGKNEVQKCMRKEICIFLK